MMFAYVILASAALACTAILAFTWLRTAEMQASFQAGAAEPKASATASLIIEYAALKERVRKLERIADGLEV
jgi:hypothetical protein